MTVTGKQVLTVAGIVASAAGLAMLLNKAKDKAKAKRTHSGEPCEACGASTEGEQEREQTPPEAPQVLSADQLDKLVARRAVIDLRGPLGAFPWS